MNCSQPVTRCVLNCDPGAHSWVRKYLGIAMEGDETGMSVILLAHFMLKLFVSEQIWGAIDFVPETEFADIRRLCFIQSKNGAGLIIPRENDSIRLYVQLLDKDVLDPQTGRVDRTRMTPEKLLEVSHISKSPLLVVDSVYRRETKSYNHLNLPLKGLSGGLYTSVRS